MWMKRKEKFSFGTCPLDQVHDSASTAKLSNAPNRNHHSNCLPKLGIQSSRMRAPLFKSPTKPAVKFCFGRCPANKFRNQEKKNTTMLKPSSLRLSGSLRNCVRHRFSSLFSTWRIAGNDPNQSAGPALSAASPRAVSIRPAANAKCRLSRKYHP